MSAPAAADGGAATTEAGAVTADAVRWGTEVSFRLGPGTADEARAIAARLAAAADGAESHVLFLAEEAGEYGCLATWPTRAGAEAYGSRPAVRGALEELGRRTDREPRVRCYRMEQQYGGPAARAATAADR